MSSEFKHRILPGLFSLMGLVCMSGCHSAASSVTASPAASAAETDAQRLIIKLRAGTLQCDADGIAGLSTAAGVRVEFIRSMSGESCVVVLHAGSAEGLLQGQELLRQQPAIEWLEVDRKMKAMPLK